MNCRVAAYQAKEPVVAQNGLVVAGRKIIKSDRCENNANEISSVVQQFSGDRNHSLPSGGTWHRFAYINDVLCLRLLLQKNLVVFKIDPATERRRAGVRNAIPVDQRDIKHGG